MRVKPNEITFVRSERNRMNKLKYNDPVGSYTLPGQEKIKLN